MEPEAEHAAGLIQWPEVGAEDALVTPLAAVGKSLKALPRVRTDRNAYHKPAPMLMEPTRLVKAGPTLKLRGSEPLEGPRPKVRRRRLVPAIAIAQRLVWNERRVVASKVARLERCRASKP